MKELLQMDESDMAIAIDLFTQGNGIGTIRRKIQSQTGRWFSEPQIRRRLNQAGFHRTQEQAYNAKRKQDKNSQAVL